MSVVRYWHGLLGAIADVSAGVSAGVSADVSADASDVDASDVSDVSADPDGLRETPLTVVHI